MTKEPAYFQYKSDRQRLNQCSRETVCQFVRFIGLFTVYFLPVVVNAQVTIAFDFNNQPVSFGVTHIEESLNNYSQQVQKIQLGEGINDANIVVKVVAAKDLSSIQKEGFEVAYKNKTLLISSIDAAGAMYGALDVAEQIRMCKNWQNLTTKKVNPHFTVRALKFNLPWSSYRAGPAMDKHLEVCRDLKFWVKRGKGLV